MNDWLSDLKDHDPCTEGYQWARESNIASLAEAFAKLERGDWWLWLARAYGIERQLVGIRGRLGSWRLLVGRLGSRRQ